MTYKEAVRQFKIQNRKLFNDRVDYWTGWEAWDCYVDILHRNEEITDRQRFIWSTPFPYGKRLKPSKLTLQAEVYCHMATN